MGMKFIISAFALMCVVSLSSSDAYSKNIADNPTSVCFRRIETVSRNIEYSNYEIIIIGSSGNIKKDIERLNTFSIDHGPMKNPSIKPFIWIGAFLYDKRFDGVHTPNCSRLPNIKLG